MHFFRPSSVPHTPTVRGCLPCDFCPFLKFSPPDPPPYNDSCDALFLFYSLVEILPQGFFLSPPRPPFFVSIVSPTLKFWPLHSFRVSDRLFSFAGHCWRFFPFFPTLGSSFNNQTLPPGACVPPPALTPTSVSCLAEGFFETIPPALTPDLNHFFFFHDIEIISLFPKGAAIPSHTSRPPPFSFGKELALKLVLMCWTPRNGKPEPHLPLPPASISMNSCLLFFLRALPILPRQTDC